MFAAIKRSNIDVNKKYIKKHMLDGETIYYREISPLQYALKKIEQRIDSITPNYSNEICKFLLYCKNIDVNQKLKLFKHRESDNGNYNDTYTVRWKTFDSDILKTNNFLWNSKKKKKINDILKHFIF